MCQNFFLFQTVCASNTFQFFEGMGFDESLVRDLMQKYIEEHGASYSSATALLDAVVERQR